MKSINVSQAINTLANIGVIAGIAFLAFEIRQNNELLAMQARSTLIATKIAEQSNVIGNIGGIADILSRARNHESLTEVERGRMFTSLNMSLYSYAAIYKEVSNGLLTEKDIPIRQWAAVLGRSPMREYWDEAKYDYDPEFIQFVEERVLTHEL